MRPDQITGVPQGLAKPQANARFLPRSDPCDSDTALRTLRFINLEYAGRSDPTCDPVRLWCIVIWVTA